MLSANCCITTRNSAFS